MAERRVAKVNLPVLLACEQHCSDDDCSCRKKKCNGRCYDHEGEQVVAK